MDRTKPLTTIEELMAYITAHKRTIDVTAADIDKREAVYFIACSEARSFYESTVKDIANTLIEGVKVDEAYAPVWLLTIFEEDEVIETEQERTDFLNERFDILDSLLNMQYGERME